jgi:hypothetical protein
MGHGAARGHLVILGVKALLKRRLLFAQLLALELVVVVAVVSTTVLAASGRRLLLPCRRRCVQPSPSVRFTA